jgi:CobQ-like glutamine amidotransferase family enzyme
MTFTIVHLFPELLGTYGDRGNVDVTAWRLTQRGIENEVIEVGIGEKIPKTADLYFLGGGEDDAQIAAMEILARKGAMRKIVDNGAHVFAVCAGLQILGESFPASGGRVIAGLGIIPIETVSANPRSVGEVLLKPTFSIEKQTYFTGFENHAGQTRFTDDLQPLGIVVRGVGNGLNTGVDGVVTPQIIGTYMHGPALVRNPGLADWVLVRKIGVLPDLDSTIFGRLHDERVKASQ